VIAAGTRPGQRPGGGDKKGDADLAWPFPPLRLAEQQPNKLAVGNRGGSSELIGSE
jgi:hypothetical protein